MQNQSASRSSEILSGFASYDFTWLGDNIWILEAYCQCCANIPGSFGTHLNFLENAVSHLLLPDITAKWHLGERTQLGMSLLAKISL